MDPTTRPSIQTLQNELLEEFSWMPEWEDRYDKVIKLGKKLAPFEGAWRTEDNRIKGCQNNVWLHADLDPAQNLVLHGESDAILVKGIVALLIHVYSGHSPKEVLEAPAGEFVEKLGLREFLSQNRGMGLEAMLRQVKYYALAYQAVVEQRQAQG
jgi:cysteine desulfuration protein SufE